MALGSWIELGEKFYEAIITAPVPLDKRALAALKRSPLALDLYAWSTYKTFSLEQHNRQEQFIPWATFMTQLGAEYGNHKDLCSSDIQSIGAQSDKWSENVL